MREPVQPGDGGAGPKALALAIADYVDGERDERPAELDLYLNTRDWGDPWGAGWMAWPAGLFLRMRFARNVYNAWRDYSQAENRVEWLNKHPGGAEIVGMVKSYRFESDELGGQRSAPVTSDELSAADRVAAWEAWIKDG